MIHLTVDNLEVKVPPGATVLDAARAAGIDIPTLCYRDGHPALTSCLVCVVRINGAPRMVPSCATKAAEGMKVESDVPAVHEARRMALELLLGDHVGDCLAPCQGVCPAKMDIPRMIRLIADGDLRGSLINVKDKIALPAVLGRICPDLCEKGCRRSNVDSAVSICNLKRFVADTDLASGNPYLPACAPDTGKRIAIVGAGPAGLAAAWYLCQQGHAVVIFDEHEEAGGNLRYAIPADELPREVIDQEVGLIRTLGATFQMKRKLGKDLSLEELRRDFAAVLLTIGETAKPSADALGLAMAGRGIKSNKQTLMTDIAGVFVAGAAVVPFRHAVRAVADGRIAAAAIGQFLAGQEIAPAERPWSVHMGQLRESELTTFMGEVSAENRLAPEADNGFAPDQASREASRCMRCDCAKLEGCKLREVAMQYGADPKRFASTRRDYERETTHPMIVYEPGKCIACGRCVQIASEAKEELGLTFVGRGLRVKVAVPFGKEMSEGLKKVAIDCAKECPTAAITLKKTD